MAKIIPLDRRFWKFVAPMTEGRGCWEWLGKLDKDGYAHIWLDGSMQRAARVSFVMANGQIPDGCIVCHTCDNPSCVKPTHLYAGTWGTNAQDRENRNRHVGRRVFSMDQADAIRTAIAIGVRQVELTRQYGVSKHVISNIAVGRTYVRVEV